MPPRYKGRGGGSLTQSIDREVHQVIRRFTDSQEQFGEVISGTQLTAAKIYDWIRQSNSSLNRRPKKVLEESIDRVLQKILKCIEDSGSDAMDGEFGDLGVDAAHDQVLSNGMNKSIVGKWSTSTSTPKRSTTPNGEQPSPDKATTKKEQTTQMTTRKANGEPLPKRRKPTTSNPIDRSPPTHVRLTDLGGVDGVIEQFEDLLVMPMTQPEIYASTRVQPPRGILIHGPPGCGKTMIANAMAAELGVNFIPISAPSIVSGMSGESEKALRDYFDEAKRCAPCLMFIDEIDAITPKREGAQREMEKRIVAQLLTCMDDLSLEKTDGKPVIVLAATNRPDSLDAALRRGGRFDKEINMTVPSEPVREQILRALTREMAIESNIDFELLAKKTPGFVGADLNDLVSTAGAIAIKRYQKTLKAQAEKDLNENEMAVDEEGTMHQPIESGSSHTTGVSSTIASFSRLVNYSKEHPMSQSIDSSTNPLVQIKFTDFTTALPKIQPSALREGFSTIPSTTFSDIGSLSTHIEELTNTIISPILNPSLYSTMGITPSSGTLLWGPPGNGKTLLAKAVANSSHANFISVKGPELLNKYVGESERAVRQVFNRARSSVPVIIFFDELDALVPRRDGTMSEASARVVNTLLTELDGVGASREGIYVIGATNRPDIIDPAMLRPGRLETLLYVGLPDEEGRVDILETLCKRLRNFEFTAEIARVARQCKGFSGADLEALLRRAGFAAIKRVQAENVSSGVGVSEVDFVAAMNEVRPSVGVDDMKRYERLQKEWGKTAG